MFERPQHRSVLAVLGALRADLLSSCKFLFGGGREAYKSAPEADLRKALAAFEADRVHQQRCFEGLQMEGTRDQLFRGLALLRQDLG